MVSRRKSITRSAKRCPSAVVMSRPKKLRQASFMPIMPIVEKWFFQYTPEWFLISRR